ncbi:TRAF3-interacting JNK-activating modulator-like [Megalops cyprinoides]|uniref:TRAF3-interacting JNK-activating modulator-like n=1 Tax=Megalops cyprinoides TaxID=118141 RepID=UPI00186485A6|nr:TRAF3-interacting JNK-activating modulator-like [Megalops cyprinoides]
MKSKTTARESQVQVCMQNSSQDGMKKLVPQMEEQKRMNEEKVLEVLQKAITERTEALKRVESLQDALQAAKAESARWQNMYQELRENCSQLRSSEEKSSDELRKGQLETDGWWDANLRDELWDGEDLHAHIALLEEDIQPKREWLQELRGASHEMLDSVAQACLSDRGSETDSLSWGKTSLQCTQQKLSDKEKECMELRAELEAMEHECHSYQSRLTQCREELRLLNARRSEKHCGSWLSLTLILLLGAAVTLMCVYHPALTHCLQDCYRVLTQQVQQNLQHCHTVLRQQVQKYLQEVASPEHSGCYQPI